MTDKYAVVWDNFSNQAFAADVTRKSFQENFEPDHQFILPSRYSSRARADACALALMGMEFDEHLIASEIWFDNSDWEGVRIESQVARDFHRARAMSGDKKWRDERYESTETRAFNDLSSNIVDEMFDGSDHGDELPERVKRIYRITGESEYSEIVREIEQKDFEASQIWFVGYHVAYESWDVVHKDDIDDYVGEERYYGHVYKPGYPTRKEAQDIVDRKISEQFAMEDADTYSIHDYLDGIDGYPESNW